MKSETYRIELVTPCFCAGADQTRAEIRAPSIRGQLRWWFRALGGTPEQEADIFGSAAGNSKGQSSRIVVRVRNLERAGEWQPWRMTQNDPGGYIWYFATVSGDKKRWYEKGDPRRKFNTDGCIPPGSTFDLEILYRRPVESALWRSSLQCFLSLGSVGMRATRAMGAIRPLDPPQPETWINEALADMTQNAFSVQVSEQRFRSLREVVVEAENWLRHMRKTFVGAIRRNPKPSPLGSAQPRQMSAIYFRPFRYSDDTYGLCLFEAPHNRVLGQKTMQNRPGPLLSKIDLKQPAPVLPPS